MASRHPGIETSSAEERGARNEESSGLGTRSSALGLDTSMPLFVPPSLFPIDRIMPWLIYRYLVSDLLRVFLLTAAVLVIIIAFGATIKPLTSDNLLTIADTLKYMTLATVPMLQFAIPFAAGFASTMVLHRMTADNEIGAAAASGISYRRLLLPVASLGIVLTLLMVLLTQWAIPRFWNIMEQTVTADATKLFKASIDRGRPFEIGNVQIYADNLRVVANPSDTEAHTRLRLDYVVAAELDRHGRIDTEVTARHAVVDIHERDGQTYLQLVMHDTVAFDERTGQLAQSDRLEPNRPVVVPRPLRDELRAMTRTELLALRDNPDRHYRVREDRTALADAMRDQIIWATIDRHLRDQGQVELIRAGSDQRRYVIHADTLEDGTFQREGESIEIRQFRGHTIERRMIAESVRFQRAAGIAFDEPTFELGMRNVEIQDMARDMAVNQREQLNDRNLQLARLSLKDLAERSSSELLERAEALRNDHSAIDSQANRLEDRIRHLDAEITARLFMRYAQSATAVLLLIIGATLAMWLRGSLPLVIYLWAFLPSIINLIMISGGDKMMRDEHMLGGLSVMWGGNIALVVLFAFAFSKLMRN